MDIVMSINKEWSQMILRGDKPLEFRTKIPNNISVGDTIYIYETAKNKGAKAVVGKCKIKDIINVLKDDGSWPTYGCYPFIDYFCSEIKKDKKSAEVYKKVKEEFLHKFNNYKHGYIITYAFCEEELENIRKNSSPLDLWKIEDFDKVKKILSEIDISNEIMEECDKWLTNIGFYNDLCESYYKYAFLLTDIEKFEQPLPINYLIDKKGEEIKVAPQSWMYVSNVKEI